jgi:hypothetical protein
MTDCLTDRFDRLLDQLIKFIKIYNIKLHNAIGHQTGRQVVGQIGRSSSRSKTVGQAVGRSKGL